MFYSKVLASAAAASLTLLAAPSHAQQGVVPTIAPTSTLLTVSAEGRSTRQPDLATFSAGVTTQGKTAAEALGANSSSMERVIASLKRAGIADRDIQTSNLNLSPVYSDPNREIAYAQRMGQPTPVTPEMRVPQIVGYRATNTVNVRQRNLTQYGKVIDTLVTAGANEVNGPSFQVENSEAALDEARSDAMRKARSRGELYARATGLKIARVVSISEGGGYYQPVVAYRMAESMAPPSAPPPPPAPVQAGEMEMRASVTVLYELTP